MAKSKSFFGLRTGSTKSLTFQVYRGLQVTKDRVTRVANPRTEAQMKQRAIIPIVAASRAALKGLVDHSFEGVNYGNDSLKKFSEINLRSGALVVESYAPNGFSNPAFANLTVSNGSLNDGGVVVATDDNNSAVRYVYRTSGSTDLKLKAAKAGDKADDVLRTIAEWGATACVAVAPGNQLTFLTVSLVDYVRVGGNRAPLSAFDISRILFPSAESTPAQVEDVNGSWRVQSNVTEGDSSVMLMNGSTLVDLAWDKGNSLLTITVTPTNHFQPTVCGGAIIRSAYLNGGWKRSNAKIFVAIPEGEDAYTYEMWRSFYESTGVSAKYLNQGDEGTGIQG